ncbi:hypothetical protein DYY67_0460 [Candidatus Nitrosotalea sp. TS]|uniref:hypothetical protein n=1 Tax=Candidatus Nitrosotalea sp. TS TaxID=2341020 RepID=UPI00140E1181|nr:hypothetical protein [Candidatus Nitrosotalea sp. TS]NHI02421.1 hypothetical protein [Candidatus Nitrosotalea sp. TS]
MKFTKYTYVGIAAAVGVAAVVVFLTQFNMMQTGPSAPAGISAYTLDFTYAEANSDLKSTLIDQNINMSKPLKFNTQSDITQYCNFLTNQTRQAMIEYCTSTEIKDEHGNFLGNLDMIGSPLSPVMVIAAAQSDPMFSNYNDVKILFGDVVNETVCQCWATEKPGNYTQLSGMMDALRDFHLKGKEPNSTTHGVPLSGKHFEIELSTTTQGYLWKLLVAK